MGNDVSKSLIELLNSGGFLGPINDTKIALIPKISKPSSPVDFDPISL